MTLQILLLLLLIVANGAFALAEIALVAARKTRLAHRAEEGDARAARALELKASPGRFLSTVQVGITLVAILTGALGGATIAESLATFLSRVPQLGDYAKPIALGIVLLAVTYLSLIIGELVPKRIGLANPERMAMFVARPMHALSTIASPVVAFLTASTDAIVRVLGIRRSDDAPVTEDEISALLAQGAEAGVFEPAEQELVERVFWLADQTVATLMTPRHRIIWIDAGDPLEAALATTAEHRHTRFIVCEGDLDHVLGMVDVKDLWASSVAREPVDLRKLLHKPIFVPETARSLNLLQQFRSTGVHLALTVDEYGQITGLVTLTDVMEGITGDIEPGPALIDRRDDGSLLVDGALHMAELLDSLGVDPPVVERGYRTVGGFVFARFARIPHVGEHFDWQGFRFEVVDMDGHRIDKVLVSESHAPGP